jgi:hypothetical protein
MYQRIVRKLVSSCHLIVRKMISSLYRCHGVIIYRNVGILLHEQIISIFRLMSWKILVMGDTTIIFSLTLLASTIGVQECRTLS